MKKILSVALSTAMAFSMFATVASANTAATPQQAFDALQAKGILQGFPDGQAHLDKDLTRAEFAIIIAKLADLEGVAGTSFRDANYANHWAKAEIEAVYKAGFMQGVGANLFQPSAKVTLQEVATVVSRILKLETPTAVNNNAALWAQGYVQSVINAGLISPAGLDFTAAANRGTVVSLVYAVDQVQSIPTLSNAVVVDASTLTVTLSDGTTHQVKLATPLVANTATDVVFTINGHEYTARVTHVVTDATKIESVSASNLKQVVVKFDGQVQKASAETVGNYNVGRTIQSATLSEDGTTVVLLLAGEAASSSTSLANQSSTRLIVSNVKSVNNTNTINQELNFTPLDTAIPTVQEVTGLGTGAFQVKFSEPVDRTTAVSALNYKINGNNISATIDYSFPDTVIVSTPLTTGEHTLTVSGVRDFAGFQVTPVENKFTVAVDTEAPTIVSATTKDLTVVEIEFNEPVRSYGSVYNGSSSRTGTVTRLAANKIKVEFAGNNVLSATENTIYVQNATDYSGNTANREVRVTPTLDTTRPEVTSVTTSVEGSNHQLKVVYSKPVSNGTTLANYTLRDSEGKVVVGRGTDGNGHPVQAIVPSTNNREFTITLGGLLPAGNYTLDIAGIQDTAVVRNTLLPHTSQLTITNAAPLNITRAWETRGASYNGKADYTVYVRFNKSLASSGAGSALEKNKYNVQVGGQYVALPSDARVDLVTPNTVRILFPQANDTYTVSNVRVSNVADMNGIYLAANSGLIETVDVNDVDRIQAVPAGSVATSTTEFKVEFAGTLSSISANDFVVVDGDANRAVQYVSHTTNSAGNTVVSFKLAGDVKLPATAGNIFRINPAVTNPTTQDEFGVLVAGDLSVPLADNIRPESRNVTVATVEQQLSLTAGEGTNEYVARIAFNEAVRAVNNTSAVTVTLQGTDLSRTGTVTLAPVSEGANHYLEVTFTASRALTANDYITVTLANENTNTKIVTDTSEAQNAAVPFTRSGLFSSINVAD